MTCRTCKFLLIGPDKDGKRRARWDRFYQCRAPVPDVQHLMPHSVRALTPMKRVVAPDEGDYCNAWEKRK